MELSLKTWGVPAALTAILPLLACIESNRRAGSADGTADSVADADTGGETELCTGGCIIADACRTNGERNPLNSCEGCDPAKNAEGWSPVQGACVAGDDFCVIDALCSDGRCDAELPALCTARPECVESVRCDRESCSATVKPDACFINGRCVANDETPGGDPCRTCDAGKDPEAWTLTDAPCDDGDECTVDDRCEEGQCGGKTSTCTDSLDCTLDYCDGGTCRHDVGGGACLIDGVCRFLGDGPPGLPCLVCEPQLANTTWSPRTAGTDCDDQDACSSLSQCTATGTCHGDWDVVDEEPNDSVSEAQYLGDINATVAFPFNDAIERGNLDQGQDRDMYRWDMLFTIGVIAPRVRVKRDVATAVEVCLYARCGLEDSFGAIVTCGDPQQRDALDDTANGCCIDVTTKDATLTMPASCGGTALIDGSVFFTMRALGAVDVSTCGGYGFDWGTVALP